MGNNRITWNVGFNVDKSQLKEVNKELKALQNLTMGQLLEFKPHLNLTEAKQELTKIKNDAAHLEQAFNKAFNPQLGTVNLKTLNRELDGLKHILPSINKTLSSMGVVGTQAFQRMASSIMETKLQLKESNKFLDDMSKTMGNTIKWGVTSRIFNGITESVQNAWDYTKRLDASLNDIRIVTGKSADEMERFARTANNAAQTLGKSTKDYTDAALIYYQQGLGEQEANKRAEITLKTASVTGQSTDTVSEQLTAVWNGYKIATDQAEATVDKLAAVAATTAADLEELSVGMSKVASAANIMGVDVDQLSATLSTVISVTRQAPETVGTAFKTIFARMGDIEAGLDGEVSLDKYTQDMLDVGGINVLNANNELRDMGDVLEEVGNKWSTMTREQQIALSQVMAGTRQYNNLLALFDNWEMYSDALVTSQNSLGTLQQQQDIYMERTTAHLHQLEAAWERVFDSFVDNKGVNSLIDVFTTLTNLLGNFTEAIGGGGTALMMFGSIATKILSKNMSQGIHTFIKNQSADKVNAEKVRGKREALEKLDPNSENKGIDIRVKKLKFLEENLKGIEVQQVETFTEMIDNIGKATEQVEMLNNKIEQAEKFLKRLKEASNGDIKGEDAYRDYLDNEGQNRNNIAFESMLTNQENVIKARKGDLRSMDARERDYVNQRNPETHRTGMINLLKSYEAMYQEGFGDIVVEDGFKNKLKANKGQLTRAKKQIEQEVNDRFKERVIQEAVDYDTQQAKKRNQKLTDDQILKTKRDASLRADKIIADKKSQGLNISNLSLDQIYENLDAEFQKKFEEYILKLVRNGKDIIEDALNENSRQIENTKEIKKEGGAQYLEDKADIDLQNANTDFDELWDDEAATRKIEQVINLTTGITDLASAAMMLGNIPDILSDDSLTTGEKVLQLVLALGSAVGTAISGYQTLTTALNTLLPAKTADAAATAAETGATVANTGAVNANKIAWMTHPIGILITVIAAVAAGVLFLTSCVENNTQKTIENNNATIDEMNKKQELIDTNRDLFKSYQDLNKAMEDGEAVTEEIISSIQSIINSYDSFVESVGATIGVNGEFINSTGDVIAGLDLASLKANAAARNYDALAESARNAQKELAKAGIATATEEERASGENVWEKAKSGKGHETVGGNYAIEIDTFGWDKDDFTVFNAVKNNTKGNVSAFEKDEFEEGDLWEGQSFTFYAGEGEATPQDIVNLYDSVKAALASDAIKNMTTEQKNNSEVYKDLNNWLKKMEEDDTILKYKNAIADKEAYSKELNSLGLQEKAKSGAYDNKTYEQIQQEVMNDLKQMDAFKNKTDEELRTLADLQLQGISDSIDELQNNYMIIKGLLNNAIFKNLDDKGKANLNKLNSEQLIQMQQVSASAIITDTEKNELKDLLNSGNIEEFNKKLKEMARRVEVASGTIGKATTKYSSLQKAKEYVEDDKSLDKDDFDLLSNEVKQFYTLMADGTYKMTGDAREFYKVIKEQEQQGFRDILEKSANPENKVSKEEIRKAQTGLASTATSNDELEAMMNSGEIATEDYKDNYERIRKVELKELDLDEDTVEIYAEEIEDAVGNIKTMRENIADTNDEAEEMANLNLDEYIEDVAVASMRLSRGAETIGENWEDWNKVLKDTTDPAYSETINELKDAVADLTNSSAEYISNDTITDHLSEIQAAAKGDTAALWELQQAVANDYLVSLGIDMDDTQIATAVNDVNNYLATLNPNDLQVGAVLNDDNFINRLNELAIKTRMSTDEMAKYLGSLGMDAELEKHTEQVESMMQVPGYTFDFSLTEGLKAKPYIEELPYTHNVEIATIKTTAQGGSGIKVVSGGKFSSNSAAKGYARGAAKKKGGGSDPDKMDKLDDKPDRYHKVDTQLTKIENNLNKIQSQEKKLTGTKLIANINAQLGQLNNRLDQLREKMKIAEGEAAELRNSLAGQGVEFNADGTIANYMEIYQAKVDYVNSLIDKYNAMSKEEQEKYKDTVEQAKEDLEKFTEDLDRYDELISDFMPGLGQEIQDAIDEQIELNIKKFNIEFEVRLDMEEAEKDWNEFKKKILDGIKDDDIYGNAKARATDDLSVYLRENGGALDNSTKRTNEVLAELKEMDATGWSDVYGDDRASALEDLKEAYSAVMEDLMEIDQIQKDVHQAWLDTMDDINDKMADQVAMYEQISNIIEHDMKVIQLVYGEEDYEALGKYYEKQHQNNLGLLDAQRMNADFWEKEMNSIDKEKDPDAWKKARDNWISAVNDLNATIEASIENARAKMENAIDETFDKFNDEITNGKGLDYLQQQWDLVNDNADDYLDTVNAAFGIRQLENKYQDAIDMTDNVSAQRKLNQLMQDELKALREKDKLTEYDIERANMKYEIAMKQLALEEAQQTKTTMRLRRDSQGNYRYEYVADEDAIGKLQEELDQLENSLYNFDKDRWLEMQNQVVDAVRERQEAIKEILMDASLSEEERAERLAEINALYNEKIQNITDQTVTAQENLYQSGADEIAKIWDAQGKDFQSLSDEEKRILVEEMLPQFETGVNDMIEKFSGEGGFEEQTTGSMEELSKATQDYKTDLEDIETASGTSFDAIEDGLDKNIPKTQQLVQDNQDLNDEYVEQIENIKELNRQLDIQIAKYKALTTASNEAAQAGHNYYMQQKQQEADAAAAEKAGNSTNSGNSNNNANANGNGETSSGSGGSSSGDGNPRVGDTATLQSWGQYYYDSYGAKPNDNKYAGVVGGVIIDSKSSKKYGGQASKTGGYDVHIKSADGKYSDLGWVHLKDLTGYDTGGYTGDWVGDYGKLALLHNKELVLNENDTKNMLSMMEIARSIVANAGPGIRAFNAGRIGNSEPDQLEQNVHIEANFPNVESASQIEEALNNLVQLASQRASRNRRG